MSETEAERTRYEEIVRNAAWLVHDGVVSMDDVAVPTTYQEDPDAPDVADDELREDVREYMPKVEAADPKTKQNERKEQQSASELDWGALWEEFGFCEPDAVGFCGASLTQLQLAIDATNQGVNVAPEVAITEAVENGEIVSVETAADVDTVATRGYCRPEGGA